jgi:vacuolar-type H+-ATPase subunit D/Vma8
MLMKARLAGAHKGHGLLKKKADALQMRFRMILSKIIEVCRKIRRSLDPVTKTARISDKDTDG